MYPCPLIRHGSCPTVNPLVVCPLSLCRGNFCGYFVSGAPVYA